MTKVSDEIMEETRRRNAEAAAAAAFPHMAARGHGDYAPGLTIRDYFAARVMQGMLSGPGVEAALTSGQGEVVIRSAVKLAFAVADEMLEERRR